MKKLINCLLLVFPVLLLHNCTSDDREIITETPEGDYANGMFVLNEGGFTNSNASLSFVDPSGEVYNQVFFGVNGFGLGDVAQSMAFYDDTAFIIMNNSNTIEVVNRYTLEHITTISDQILNPRYMVFYNGYGFVTNWGDPVNTTDDYVAVVNLQDFTVTQTIVVAEGPERLLEANGSLYVAHKGGWGYGNSVSVINANTFQLSTTINVADVPDGIVISDNDLYVLCSGKADWTGDETLAEFFKISLQNNEVIESFQFTSGVHPSFLEVTNNELFYVLSGDVFKVSTGNFISPTGPLFSTQSQSVEVVYGFRVYNDNIYIADAKDYASNGEVFVYDLQGNFQTDYRVQLIPNSFYFNN
ncbi:YncE family protein [Winogradskyella sp.]|uniref:YncE family protein n=1 Tax=Winogradskyella sp. TaxID=1883156 RepID=UPI002603C272|nr:DUF5074 domain-containing protein [Winogradskyella sp.]